MRSSTKRAALMLAVAAVALSGCSVLRGNGPAATPTVGNRTPILGAGTSLEVDPAIAGLEVILPPAVPNADWNQPGGNAAKSLGHVSLGETLTQAWTAQIDGGSNRARLASAPVVASGTLYAIDVEAMVHAFDAATGARRWSVKIGDTERDGQSARFGGGVSADGTMVYAASGLGDVAAIDPATGAIRWSVRPSGPLRGAPTLAFGNVFVMGQDNQLFALRASDGVVQWQAAGSVAPGSVFGVAAPAAGLGTIVAGYSSGELNAYRYENGRPLWEDALARTSITMSVSTLSDIDADPVIDRGRVFAIGQGGRMAAYELTSGSRLWELSMAGIATPWVAGEWVFVVSDDARVYCIARATGKIRWIGQLPRWRDEEDREGAIRWTGPVLAGGRLMLVSTDGRMAEVEPGSGAIRSLTALNAGTRLPPLVANGMLYVLDDTGRITAWR